MSSNIIGIECSLYGGRIEHLLQFFSNCPYEFYIKWLQKGPGCNWALPVSFCNLSVSSSKLRKLAEESIWELVLQVYPIGSNWQPLETYEEYLLDQCLCCLLFYDCGMTEIFVKNFELRNQLHSLLISIGAKDIEIISDESCYRRVFSV